MNLGSDPPAEPSHDLTDRGRLGLGCPAITFMAVQIEIH